jgi:hypothetical protein
VFVDRQRSGKAILALYRHRQFCIPPPTAAGSSSRIRFLRIGVPCAITSTYVRNEGKFSVTIANYTLEEA